MLGGTQSVFPGMSISTCVKVENTQAGTIPRVQEKGNEYSQRLFSLKKNISLIFNLRSYFSILNQSADTEVWVKSPVNISFYNTLYLIKEFAFFVYTGMLYSLCILQGYKMSLILNITPDVISGKKKVVKLNLTLKKSYRQATLKQNWINKILAYLTTQQTSCPSPLLQKTLT